MKRRVRIPPPPASTSLCPQLPLRLDERPQNKGKARARPKVKAKDSFALGVQDRADGDGVLSVERVQLRFNETALESAGNDDYDPDVMAALCCPGEVM